MATRTRRTFSESDRRKVLDEVPELGGAKAAEKHGVWDSCACRWAKQAGVA